MTKPSNKYFVDYPEKDPKFGMRIHSDVEFLKENHWDFKLLEKVHRERYNNIPQETRKDLL